MKEFHIAFNNKHTKCGLPITPSHMFPTNLFLHFFLTSYFRWTQRGCFTRLWWFELKMVSPFHAGGSNWKDYIFVYSLLTYETILNPILHTNVEISTKLVHMSVFRWHKNTEKLPTFITSVRKINASSAPHSFFFFWAKNDSSTL